MYDQRKVEDIPENEWRDVREWYGPYELFGGVVELPQIGELYGVPVGTPYVIYTKPYGFPINRSIRFFL